MEKYERGELAKKILLGFVVGGLVTTCVILPGVAQIYKLVEANNSKERDRVRQSVGGLMKRGLIKRRIQNGKEELMVTPKGQAKLSSYLSENLEIKRQKRWDKRWRVLMFDIPEKKGRVRREVSFKLRDMGMLPIQHSVFVCPFPCKKEIDFVANHFSVQKYFIYFEADTIECEEDVLSRFNLK